MENLVGLLRIRVKRGINLVSRDSNTSDPFVVVTMGSQVSLMFSVFKIIPCRFQFRKNRTLEDLRITLFLMELIMEF